MRQHLPTDYGIHPNSWLEASTFSNRGEMRQHLPTDKDLHPNSWLEASTKAQCSLLIGVLASILSRDDEIQYTVTHAHKYITRYEADNRSRLQYLSLTRS